ncbi:glycogen synthase [Pyrococcus furiosus DSM 3638]|uniref:Glycogen synthase n=3 Tax=Pyrococcus furiosus TaxID=2261 RepID=A0A5C0XUR4_PYRFU|nr:MULTISPECIES: glycogen/starch synthase [Pyrococcus]AAL82168.1 glycogen synthase [Pyrococcus furiosus DSM 3638]AFN04599.1 glycogen synthase [Pyrococcus furiosus COM1]MDK2870013.1 glycogen synthase [Pyrococcus sp.]QEK79634.1 glycogen synthase [Pyrococcus furiosus DSM 3638]
MKVLLLGFEYLPIKVGGLAEALTYIAKALASLGNETIVFTPAHGQFHGESIGKVRAFGEEVEIRVHLEKEGNLRVYRIGGGLLDSTDVYGPGWDGLLKKSVLFGKASVLLLNKLLEKEELPDVVHFHDWHTVFAGALIKKYFKIPAVFTIHRLNKAKVPAYYFHEANLSELAPYPDLDPEHTGGYVADMVTTVSRGYLLDEWGFFRNFEGKVTYVFNGIDCSFWSEDFLDGDRETRKERLLKKFGLEKGTTFMFIGRFDRGQKGVDVLLRAIEILSQIYKDFSSLRFIIVGKGDPELENWARSLATSYKNVVVITQMLSREFVRELYGSVDFVVIPSYFEPFGLVQLEAMCLGAIPIASSVGGLRDTIISLDKSPHNATGLLVPPGDPWTLANAMIKMAELNKTNKELIEELRENCKKRAREFSWKKAAERYIKVYRGNVERFFDFISTGV